MGYNSYRIFKKQYSLDNGETWADVDPIVGEPKYVTSFDSLNECALDTYSRYDRYTRCWHLTYVKENLWII